MAARFFAENIQQGDNRLSDQEAQHAAGARRLRPGEEVELFDGNGAVGRGSIAIAKSREVIVTIESIERLEAPKIQVEIAVAVPKGKRLQYMVEKVTELGCGVIRPVVFERSVAGGGSDPVERWGRWSLEACKQCGRYFLPQIEQPVHFGEFINTSINNTEKSIFLADASGALAGVALAPLKENICCIIGPEGGLSDPEFAACDDAAIPRIMLGSHILRIETAAVAFCAVAGSLN